MSELYQSLFHSKWDCEYQSYLIQDEPGGGGYFSYKMSLEERFGMLGFDSQRAEQTRVEPGGDPGVFERQR